MKNFREFLVHLLFASAIFLFFCTVVLFISCNVEIDDDSKKDSKKLQSEQTEQLIKGFYVTASDSKATVEWAPIVFANDSEKYKISLLQQKLFYEWVDKKLVYTEDEKVSPVTVDIVTKPGETQRKVFDNLENLTLENCSKPFVYAYTLSIYKDGTLIESQRAEVTPCGSFENDYVDTPIQVLADILTCDSPVSINVTTANEVSSQIRIEDFKIKGIKGVGIYGKSLNIHHNPTAIKKLVEDGKCDYSRFTKELESGEDIEWIHFYKSGYRFYLRGRIIKKSVLEKGYTEVSDYEVETAVGEGNSLVNLEDAFRIGTKIRTKGYFSVGDGGGALYTVSNRPSYKYASIKTKSSQYLNMKLESGFINLISLGAGKCFQITSEKAKFWRENKSTILDNDDGDRIEEAHLLLREFRTKNKVEDTSIPLELFIPAGEYRIQKAVNASMINYTIRGETNRRHFEPEQLDSFESNYALGCEKGSSLDTGFHGTVLYTDNGCGCNHLNIYGPADNVLVEGITFESRETDSKRTFWYKSKDSDGKKHGINFIGDGSLEKTMADEQWYSRQVMISQCKNITLKNCEFIITSHVRDQARFPSNIDEYKEDINEFDFDGPEFITEKHGNLNNRGENEYFGYQANPYVEWCDLHTDKQFTNVTFYSGWKNVKLDDCLLYNMSGVFRGANFGYLDFYAEQCFNGTVNNCSLYHNCHDEQIGIFSLTPNAVNYKESECIEGVYFTNNKVYPMRDEHVDKIKTRVMVFTVGYDGSKNIRNVYIQKNLFYLDSLPSKCFTFGGDVWDGRNETFVTDNHFIIKNGGGYYIFESARPYVRINNNTFDYIPKPESNGIGGICIDARRLGYISDWELEVLGNTFNVYGDSDVSFFTNDGLTVNGKFNGNKINILGNASCLITGAREAKNNSVFVQGELKGFYTGKGKMDSSVVIEGNKIETCFDDSENDYSKAPFYDSGREGWTFVDAKFQCDDEGFFNGNGELIISNNELKAPNCTRVNKHFMRYAAKGLNVIGIGNKIQKYQYFRNLTESNIKNILFLNNFDNYGNLFLVEDWAFPNYLANTENAYYSYLPETKTYMVSKNFSLYEIPDFYDDGTHGKHRISAIGEGVYKDKKWVSVPSKFPDSLVEIGKEAFCGSHCIVENLPSNLKTIGYQAFYGCNNIGKNTKRYNNKTKHTDYELFIPKSVEKIEPQAFYVTDRKLIINCEVESKPEGWAENWYLQNVLNDESCIEVNWGKYK